MYDLTVLRERLRKQRPVPWEQLPDFSLYMDQVLSYMDRQVIRFDEDDGLTAAMGRYRLYCAYYWPLRLRWQRLIAAVYHSDESESKRLYWRVFLIGDLLLGRRWNRL